MTGVQKREPPPDPSQPNVYPVTSDFYDTLGRLQSETVAQSVSGGTTISTTTNYVHEKTGDEDAPVVEEIDAAGTALARTINYSYDGEDNLLTESDGLGRITSFEYDKNNRQMAQQDAPVTSYGYDLAGELTTTTNAIGLTQTDTFDGLGRVTDEVAFDGVTTANSYNLLSQLVSTEQQGGGITANQTTNAYDNLGRLVSSTDGNQGATNFGYDLVGNRTSLTDGDGNVTNWKFDTLGRPIAERLPTGALQTYQYDANGNLLQSVDGDGHIIKYAYNALNEPTSETWQTMPALVSTRPKPFRRS